MPAEIEAGEIREISVVGHSSHPNVVPYEVSILDNDTPSIMKITGAANTVSEREHPSHNPMYPMKEINMIIFARELFTEANEGFPYGSNPRLPVLCGTFTDIYTTVVDSDDYLNFISYNTGIDVFANSAVIDGDEITLTFDGSRDGIANGGLTYSILQYASSQNQLPEDLRVSLRIWTKDEQSIAEKTKVADKRNSHRPLTGIDKLNQMGAFENMKETLDEAFVERVVWHTGDQQVDQDGNIGVADLCRTLYSFKIKASGNSNERHPTLNPKDPEGIESVYESIEMKGTISSPNTGVEKMWEAIGGDQ